MRSRLLFATRDGDMTLRTLGLGLTCAILNSLHCGLAVYFL